MLNKRIIYHKRIRGSFLFWIIDFDTQEVYSTLFQFSFKDPWWLPRYEPEYGKIKTPLYGWLFFYFGRETSGVIVPAKRGEVSTAKKPIYDRFGNRWHMYGFDDKQMAKNFRKIIKRHKAEISVAVEEDKVRVIARIGRRRVFGL